MIYRVTLMGQMLKVLAIFIIGLNFTSCTTTGTFETKDDAAHDTATLERQVHKLWNARIANDWKTAYQLMDSKYQLKMPKEKFYVLGEFKGVAEYSLENILPDKANPDRSSVLVRFKINKMGSTFNPVVKEYWIFEKKGGWVLDKTRMTTQNNSPF